MKSCLILLLICFVTCARACLLPLDLLECFGGSLDLKCPETYQIKIMSAFYGRADYSTCPVSSGSTSCSDPGALNTVKASCQGHQSCTISATTPPFTDNCPKTKKYLKVRYSCCKEGGQPDGCVVKPVPIYPEIKGCTVVEQVWVQRCEGGCPSSSHLAFGKTEINKKCTCCVPVKTRQQKIKVACQGSDSRVIVVTHIDACDCKPCQDAQNPVDRCEVEDLKIVPYFDDCETSTTINIKQCVGGCPSDSYFSFGTKDLNKKCTCCVPSQLRWLTGIVNCIEGNTKQFRYQEVAHCDCQLCEDDLLPNPQ